MWTRRTSNCLQVLLCPVGGALATVRPVRSRSSAALAASRDPASRKSSDQPEDTRPLRPPLLHTPPLGLPGLRLHLTFHSFDFLLRLYGRCSGRSDFVFGIAEELFRMFMLLEAFIQIFHHKDITRRWRRSFSSGFSVSGTLSESPVATLVTYVKLLGKGQMDKIWKSHSCSLDVSQIGKDHGEKFCSLIHNNTSFGLCSDFTLQCEPNEPNEPNDGVCVCGGGLPARTSMLPYVHILHRQIMYN